MIVRDGDVILIYRSLIFKELLLDIFNNYDGPTYVNIKYVNAINFN